MLDKGKSQINARHKLIVDVTRNFFLLQRLINIINKGTEKTKAIKALCLKTITKKLTINIVIYKIFVCCLYLISSVIKTQYNTTNALNKVSFVVQKLNKPIIGFNDKYATISQNPILPISAFKRIASTAPKIKSTKRHCIDTDKTTASLKLENNHRPNFIV